jgi:hypothetical protein
MSISKVVQGALGIGLVVVMTGCGLAVSEAPVADVGAVAPREAVQPVVEAEEAAVNMDTVEETAPVEMARGEVAGADDAAKAVERYDADAIAAVPTAIAPRAEGEMAAEADFAAEPDFALQQTPPLRAGEVNDNAQWDDYLLYRRNYSGPMVHDRDISERYNVEVTDSRGRPVLGAEVSFSIPGQKPLEIFRAQTMANGQVLFHPLALDVPVGQIEAFLVQVSYNNSVREFPLQRLSSQPTTGFTEDWTVSLNNEMQRTGTVPLDVLFLLDATGSMADEIAKIQNTIFDVSAQIDALPETPEVRYGLVTYRDRGDSYITQSYDFTPDVREFSRNLDMVWADGGGDYPESLNEGLHQAINNVEWRGPGAVKLIFLVADAPPHLDYAQDYDYAVEMETAAQRGIKIFPIASSGLDDQGEYIFRQIAQYSQGRFIFLTYDGPTNGGAPGDDTTHHVEDYSVDNLDSLLVRLVREELAYQNQDWGQGQ